jgi:hypothetical protein
MDRSAHSSGPDARLNIAWWLDQLASAPDVPSVMIVVNLFARAWPADEIEAMPPQCRPGRLETPDDVANFAYTLARAQLAGNANTRGIHALAMFFTDASTRLSRMLGLPQLDAATSRLFLSN